ncbi:2Fe-2S iron-sulfur cluster-binding protein [Streptomyces sp. NPDC058417]|uniref:2Fe-2S iron-sulfur cluster-binding protein n=3 Tax=Streptomyces TaxID=1883 RepID=UPI0036609D45
MSAEHHHTGQPSGTEPHATEPSGTEPGGTSRATNQPTERATGQPTDWATTRPTHGPTNRLTSVAEVEAVVGRPAAMVVRKQIRALDDGCREVLAYSPLAAFGYRDAQGTARTTFVGGAPGFAQLHSPTRISFAVPGPAAAPGPVSLFFLMPGVGEVLRVNGTATKGGRGGRTSVDVAEAYVHCAQAVIRSRLWEPPAPAPAEGTAPVPGEGPLGAPAVGAFLAAAPFLALSTWDADGGSDTSPRGEARSVVRVLDGRTLALADRKGNRRADSLHNLLQDDRVSFAALVPGRSGVLHVRGRAVITDDPALRETLALRGTPPHLVLLIDVEHAEVTGSPAVADARPWARGGRPGAGEAPDMMALGSAHLTADTDGSGRVSGRLLKLLGAVPGLSRLMRKGIDVVYVRALRKEGYDDVRAPVAAAPTGPAADPEPLRRVRVAGTRRETPTATTLVLEDATGAPQGFVFRPGQFFTLVAEVEGRTLRRAYSASSVPGASRLEVTVKHVPGGRFSAHVQEGGLRTGDLLALRGPSGTFHLPEEVPEDLVLVAAGSGITPLMSMIRTRLSDPDGRDRLWLLHGSRRAEETVYGDELARLQREHPDRFAVTPHLSARDGRLDAARVRAWVTGLPASGGAHHFVCGPAPLMDLVGEVLDGLGVPQERRHRERFTPGADVPAGAGTPWEMSVEDDGKTVGTAVVEPGQTLLDAGLAAGLPMPYSCTVGACGECVVRLRGGRVTEAGTAGLSPEQKAAGCVLTCVGSPLSEVTLDLAVPPDAR